MKNCPVCGHLGDDLVFSFYCFNPICQNYVAPKTPVVQQQESTTKYFFYKKPEIMITNGYGFSIDDIVTSFQYCHHYTNKQSLVKNDRVLGFPVQVPQLYPMKDIVPFNPGKYFESKNVSSYDVVKDDILIPLPIQVVKTTHRIQLLEYSCFDYPRYTDKKSGSIPKGNKNGQ